MAANLVLVGAGKMGGALLTGLLSSGHCRLEEVVVVEPSVARREELVALHPGLTVVPSLEAGLLEGEGGAILAVKPEQAEPVAGLLAAVGIDRVLSLVAGISTARLEAKLAPGARVIRSMPNTASMVGAGAAAISAGSAAHAEDLAWAEGILSSVGMVVRVPERQLDAVTAVSGSGPAYLFLVAEAMVEGAVCQGLPRDLALELVSQTLLGAGTLLRETDQSPEQLRAAVTSPAGTTAAGLRILELKGARSAFIEAIQTAAERSRQLGHQ